MVEPNNSPDQNRISFRGIQPDPNPNLSAANLPSQPRVVQRITERTPQGDRATADFHINPTADRLETVVIDLVAPIKGRFVLTPTAESARQSLMEVLSVTPGHGSLGEALLTPLNPLATTHDGPPPLLVEYEPQRPITSSRLQTQNGNWIEISSFWYSPSTAIPSAHQACMEWAAGRDSSIHLLREFCDSSAEPVATVSLRIETRPSGFAQRSLAATLSPNDTASVQREFLSSLHGSDAAEIVTESHELIEYCLAHGVQKLLQAISIEGSRDQTSDSPLKQERCEIARLPSGATVSLFPEGHAALLSIAPFAQTGAPRISLYPPNAASFQAHHSARLAFSRLAAPAKSYHAHSGIDLNSEQYDGIQILQNAGFMAHIAADSRLPELHQNLRALLRSDPKFNHLVCQTLKPGSQVPLETVLQFLSGRVPISLGVQEPEPFEYTDVALLFDREGVGDVKLSMHVPNRPPLTLQFSIREGLLKDADPDAYYHDMLSKMLIEPESYLAQQSALNAGRRSDASFNVICNFFDAPLSPTSLLLLGYMRTALAEDQRRGSNIFRPTNQTLRFGSSLFPDRHKATLTLSDPADGKYQLELTLSPKGRQTITVHFPKGLFNWGRTTHEFHEIGNSLEGPQTMSACAREVIELGKKWHDWREAGFKPHFYQSDLCAFINYLLN